MKIYGAINDGFRFIYSTERNMLKEFLYIYQENFCMLKIFELNIEKNYLQEKFLNKDIHYQMNFSFDKRKIEQKNYDNFYEISDQDLGSVNVFLKDDIALVLTREQMNLMDLKNCFAIDLTKDEYTILQAIRNFSK